jgi:hypothetical protein
MDLSQKFAMMSPEQKKKFYQGPAMVAPPNVAYNLENPPNENALAIGLLTTCAFLSTLAVVVRFYPRLFMTKRISLRLEDCS